MIPTPLIVTRRRGKVADPEWMVYLNVGDARYMLYGFKDGAPTQVICTGTKDHSFPGIRIQFG